MKILRYVPCLRHELFIFDYQFSLASCFTYKVAFSIPLLKPSLQRQMLLSWFLSNLTSESATIRRASTDAAISVCQNSRNPAKYLKVRPANVF